MPDIPSPRPILIIWVHRDVPIDAYSSVTERTMQQELIEQFPEYHTFVLHGTRKQEKLAKFEFHTVSDATEIDFVSLKQLIINTITNAQREEVQSRENNRHDTIQAQV